MGTLETTWNIVMNIPWILLLGWIALIQFLFYATLLTDFIKNHSRLIV